MTFRNGTTHLIRLLALIPCLALAVGSLSAQQQAQQAQPPDAKTAEEIAAIHQEIIEALDQHLFDEERDKLYILALAHSKILVPEAVQRIQAALNEPSTDRKLIARLADIIAYAADETAADALSHLCAQDEKLFGYFVERLLNYAGGSRNPYTLAYYVLETGGSEVVPHVMRWVLDGASLPSYHRVWAQALFERYQGIPSESELQRDAVISRLSAGLPSGVRSELVLVAKESIAKPGNR